MSRESDGVLGPVAELLIKLESERNVARSELSTAKAKIERVEALIDDQEGYEFGTGNVRIASVRAAIAGES